MLKIVGAFVVAITAAMAGPAPAEENHEAKVAGILGSFLDEQRVNLTCSTLDPLNHKSIIGLWELFVQDVLSLLDEGGVPASTRAGFADAARPEALVMAGDTPFAEVRAFCDAHPDWSRDYSYRKSFPRYSELRTLLGDK